jgi:hypothetical protein
LVVAYDVIELGQKALEAALQPDVSGKIMCDINVYVDENLPITRAPDRTTD